MTVNIVPNDSFHNSFLNQTFLNLKKVQLYAEYNMCDGELAIRWSGDGYVECRLTMLHCTITGEIFSNKLFELLSLHIAMNSLFFKRTLLKHPIYSVRLLLCWNMV